MQGQSQCSRSVSWNQELCAILPSDVGTQLLPHQVEQVSRTRFLAEPKPILKLPPIEGVRAGGLQCFDQPPLLHKAAGRQGARAGQARHQA